MANRASACGLASIAALLLAAPAGAELLAFDGRVVAVLPGLGEAEVASGPGVARVEGLVPEEVEILTASLAGTATLPVTDPSASPVTAIRLQASLRSGTLSIDPSAPPFGEPALAGPFPLPGVLRVCMLIAPLPPCIGGFELPLTQASGTRGVGVGGLLTIGNGTATVQVSLYGAPFTLNTAWASGETANGAVATLFSTGSIAGPAGFTSSAGQPGGGLSVVAPLRTTSNSDPPDPSGLPGFLRLEVRFVPEPVRGLSLAAGGLSLLRLARRRRRPRPGRSRSRERSGS